MGRGPEYVCSRNSWPVNQAPGAAAGALSWHLQPQLCDSGKPTFRGLLRLLCLLKGLHRLRFWSSGLSSSLQGTTLARAGAGRGIPVGKARDPVTWLEKDFGMGRGQALDIILQRKHLPNCPVEYGAFEMLRTSTVSKSGRCCVPYHGLGDT